MKIIDKVLDEKSDETMAFFWQLIGPLFILCTFALDPSNLLVFSVGVMGLILSARFQMKGFIASLILLSGVAAGEHIVFHSWHLWSLGLEGSYAVAFFITAQNADRHHSFIKTLLSQIEIRSSSLLHLEEEFTKSQTEGTKQQVIFQEKVDLLQKQIEEALSEHASLLILNEVLRKTTARHIADHNVVKDQLFDAQMRLESERNSREELEREVRRFKNESAMIQENQQLTDELNAIRADREQTSLINEALSRFHVKESQRAQVACDQLVSYENEKRKLEAQMSLIKRELETLRSQLEEAISERNRYQLSAQRSDAIQTERNFLKDRLRMAEHALSQGKENSSVDLSQYVLKDVAMKLEEKVKELQSVPQATVDLSKYVGLEEKVKELSQVESLYKQLKVQFEEKNQILHKTRSELFHTDNALQAIKLEMDKNELTANIVPQEILTELTALEGEVSCLTQENEELQSLVTSLCSQTNTDPSKRKKKVKVIPDQEYLF